MVLAFLHKTRSGALSLSLSLPRLSLSYSCSSTCVRTNERGVARLLLRGTTAKALLALLSLLFQLNKRMNVQTTTAETYAHRRQYVTHSGAVGCESPKGGPSRLFQTLASCHATPRTTSAVSRPKRLARSRRRFFSAFRPKRSARASFFASSCTTHAGERKHMSPWTDASHVRWSKHQLQNTRQHR